MTPEQAAAMEQARELAQRLGIWGSGLGAFPSDPIAISEIARAILTAMETAWGTPPRGACYRCVAFNRNDSTCHLHPPVRLPRKFDQSATSGNRVRDEELIWGWPKVLGTAWCRDFVEEKEPLI